jgi:transcriptional regulator with XRE-family HTH domain
MSETAKLISGLKSELKVRGLTYRDLAERLGLSEPSVKRLFAEESFTLERFAKACEVIGSSMGEIFKQNQARDASEVAHLTHEQEEMLAADPIYFDAFHLLLRGDSVEQIQKRLKLDSSQMTRALVGLDKIGCIELHSQNVIRFKTPRLIKWDNAGPLMKAYGAKAVDLYFKDSFKGTAAYSRFLTGPISDRVAIIIEERLKKFAREIEDMWDWDIRSKSEEHRKQHGILLSSKPWTW